MPFEWKSLERLNLGVNYRDLAASRTSSPGQAQDAVNCLPREDGGFAKTFGWLRVNDTALNGTPLAMQGFTYRGKNTVGGDVRDGNLGLSNDAPEFTRREAEYPGYLLLTTTDAYVWDPLTESFLSVVASLPAGVTIAPIGKPTIEVVQDNCYIVGWSDQNLRFDPVDRVFYRWGWEEEPGDPTVAPQGGGDLIQNSDYQYAVSFQDIYTGEESIMGGLVPIETTDAIRSALIDTSSIVYNGDRHFNTTPGGTSSDIATVVWRTGANDNSPRFLDILNPGVTTLADDGLVRETSLRPYRSIQRDEPPFIALKIFKGRFYGIPAGQDSNRVLFSHFDKASYFERWKPLDFRDLEVPDGEVLTAVGGTDATLLVFSQRGCFRISVAVSVTQVQITAQRLPWHVGSVGARARLTVDGWEYFLSERGPYRWKEGMTAPDEIGENLLPLFIDHTSGLCKLTAETKDKSEVGFDWNSNTVRFTFPLGPGATRVNTHMAYWITAAQYAGSAHAAWWPQSPDIQAMALTSALTPGVVAPRTRKQNLVWADTDGYVYEYISDGKRAGLGEDEIAITTVGSLISTSIIQVQDSPLFLDGDGLAGMRLEIQGVPDPVTGLAPCEVYEILTNTGTGIEITTTFTRDPEVDDIVRIAGIQAFWRSWYDDLGLAHQHKTMMDFSLGFMDRNNPDGSITINIGSGERPTVFSRQSTAVMNKYRKKFTVARTAVWFMYEFSNSIPDELFLVTDFDREVELVPARRKA